MTTRDARLEEAWRHLARWMKTKPPSNKISRILQLPLESPDVSSGNLLAGTQEILITSCQECGRVDGEVFSHLRESLDHAENVAHSLLKDRHITKRTKAEATLVLAAAVSERSLFWEHHIHPKRSFKSTDAQWHALRSLCLDAVRETEALVWGILERQGLTKLTGWVWDRLKFLRREPSDEVLLIAAQARFLEGKVCFLLEEYKDAIEGIERALFYLASTEDLLSDGAKPWQETYFEAIYELIEAHFLASGRFELSAMQFEYLKTPDIGILRQKHPSFWRKKPPNMSGLIVDVQFPIRLYKEIDQAYTQLPEGTLLIEFLISHEFFYVLVSDSKGTKPFRMEIDGVMCELLKPTPGTIFPITVGSEEFGALFENPEDALSSRMYWMNGFPLVQIDATEKSNPSWLMRSGYKVLQDSSLWRETIRASCIDDAINELGIKNLNHIIISADGTLNSMPLHIFPNMAGERLCDQYRVTYIPNVSSFAHSTSAKDELTRNGKLVMLSDPSHSLKYTLWECKNIANIFTGQTVIIDDNVAASIASIQSECRNASVFHFSGHAVYDKGIKLSEGEWLSLKQLEKMDFSDDAIVFLSACETGSMDFRSRASVSSIAYSFLKSNAATVIASLWVTHDAAAAIVSRFFYDAFCRQRLGRAESLEFAIKRLRSMERAEAELLLGSKLYITGLRPFDDEYFWGGYVLFGAW